MAGLLAMTMAGQLATTMDSQLATRYDDGWSTLYDDGYWLQRWLVWSIRQWLLATHYNEMMATRPYDDATMMAIVLTRNYCVKQTMSTLFRPGAVHAFAWGTRKNPERNLPT